ncbi:MAG: SET domain-containing protein [Planctomycetaceae bacterium]|nr:SET domain-containing protein [Planctomycetaceae bacterium]
MMLLVDARIGPSRIHGLGLIAQAPIAKGTVVWRLEPTFDVVIPESQLAQLSLAARRALAYYAVFDIEKRVFILSSDDDRFTNHADDPNCSFHGEQRASRAIAAGEEITVNYRELGWTQFGGMPLCGAIPPPPPPEGSRMSDAPNDAGPFTLRPRQESGRASPS